MPGERNCWRSGIVRAMQPRAALRLGLIRFGGQVVVLREFPFFCLLPMTMPGVGLWECGKSRVLCEISKSLWKPFLGSVATSFPQPFPFLAFHRGRDRIQGMLDPCPLADRRSWRLLRGRC
jgi:hypothetical protein